MPGKHNAGGCACCDICTSNETARQILLAQLGLSTIAASGGPNVSATQDYRKLTCAAEGLPDGSSFLDYPAFDFSASTSSAISTTPSGAGYLVCPPYTTGGQISKGSLEFHCGSAVACRGFDTRLGSNCQSTSGGPYLFDYFASFRASIVFTCTSGVSSYVLGIQSSFIMFMKDPISYFTAPGASGTDWTRTGSGFYGTFTKNGSTAESGASVDFSLLSSSGGFDLINVSASAHISNPNTTVSLWTPNPVIDWSGLTHSGTATLT